MPERTDISDGVAAEQHQSQAEGDPSGAAYDVVVSIISMGDAAQLSDCLEALAGAAAGLAWVCRVVDNSPSAGLVAAAATKHGAETIRVEGRRGFSTNHNTVLRPLTSTGEARYALVLNDDVLLDSGALATMVAHLDANEQAGVAAPQLLHVDRSAAPTKMAFPTLVSEIARWFSQRQLADITAPGWVVGACMLFRVAALRAVDSFDDGFFLFYEDVDVCRRITNVGYRCDLVPPATAVHVGHQSVGTITVGSLGSREYRRGRWRYFVKHRQPLAAVVLTAASWAVVPLRRFSSPSRAERRAAQRVELEAE